MATIKNPTMVISGGGGGSIVNGIIKQYKASVGTISANTFVEFVNGWDAAQVTDTTIASSSSTAVASLPKAALIEDGKVMIVYAVVDSTSTTPYAIVASINGTNVTTGSPVALAAAASGGSRLGAVPVTLDANRVFVAIQHYTTSYKLVGRVCTVSDLEITLGTQTTVGAVEETTYAQSLDVEKIDDDSVFLVFGYQGYSRCGVCKISGSTITVGSKTNLPTPTSSAYFWHSISAIDTNRVFVAANGRGVACTISGTTVTVGSSTVLADSGQNLAASTPTLTAKIAQNTVFVAYRNTNAGYGLNCAKVCSVGAGGTVITVNKSYDVRVNTENTLPDSYPSCVVDGDQVIIAGAGYRSATTQAEYDAFWVFVCTVSGTKVNADFNFSIADAYRRCSGFVLIDNNTLLLPWVENNDQSVIAHLRKRTFDVAVAAASTRIDGLTKTLCDASAAGNVWVLRPPYYGTVYYKASESDTEVLSVELQSLEEFNSLVGTSSASFTSAVVGKESVTVRASGTNVIVGIDIGDAITSIPAAFLRGCESLNMPINMPDSVTAIGDRFLYGCHGYNQPIKLSNNLKTIATYFMTPCHAFNQPVNLPASLESIGVYFMYQCWDMTNTVNVGSLDSSVIASSAQSFGSTSKTAACYTTGITIAGANRADWIAKFPNSASSPYRKLIDAGE